MNPDAPASSATTARVGETPTPSASTPFWAQPFTLGWLLAVTALALFLRLWIFNGLYGHDDFAYLFYIRSFLNHDAREMMTSPHGLRWGVWVPIVALFKLFGVHYWLVFAPGFVMGLLSIPLAYWITWRISGSVSAARWASLALVFNPVDWFVSTTLRGDIEISCYSGLIFAGLILCEDFRRTQPTRAVGVAILTGVTWALAAMTKEWAFVYAWGFLALVLWRTVRERRIPWEYAYILVGFAAAFAIDAAVLQVAAGHYNQRGLISLSWYERMRLEGGFAADRSLSYGYLPSLFLNLSNSLSEYGRFENGYPYLGWYFCLFVGAIIWGIFQLRSPGSPWSRLLPFIFGTLLWMEFGTISLAIYLPFHKEPRYLTILSVPIACCIGVALQAWWVRLKPRGRMVLAILLVALGVSTERTLYAEHLIYRGTRDFLPEVAAWLQNNPANRVWAWVPYQQEIDLRSGYSFSDPVHHHVGKPGFGSIQDLAFMEQGQPGDLILLDPRTDGILGPLYPRDRWQKVADFTGPHSEASLYRMPDVPVRRTQPSSNP